MEILKFRELQFVSVCVPSKYISNFKAFKSRLSTSQVQDFHTIDVNQTFSISEGISGLASATIRDISIHSFTNHFPSQLGCRCHLRARQAKSECEKQLYFPAQIEKALRILIMTFAEARRTEMEMENLPTCYGKRRPTFICSRDESLQRKKASHLNGTWKTPQNGVN